MRTITFYSYKGGTGRTLAVANTARFLARFKHRVFVLDLDLEAPGLHYKFGLRGRKEEKPVLGLVDFLHSFTTSGLVAELAPYVYSVGDLPPEFEGSISLMPAGNAPSPEYSQQLAEIRLHELFHPEEGESSEIPIAVPLFLALKEQIKAEYDPDYLLIDSRTGVTEIGGVAVRLMPDTVVCLLHNNDENLSGSRKVLRNVRTAPRDVGQPPIEIIAALARIPEMQLAEEEVLLEKVQDYLNEPSANFEENLALSRVLSLHSDPNLQIVEALLIGSHTTANESTLLRDYFKLFLELGLDAGLKPDEKAVLKELAEADRKDKIRTLLVGGRHRGGESSQTPIVMIERLQERSNSNLKVVNPAYLTGPIYRKFVNRILRRIRKNILVPGTDPLPEDEVRWDLLAVHLREGVLDFCSDIYYLTENRSHLVEIVQLGWCFTFTTFVRTDSPTHRHLKEKFRCDISGASSGGKLFDILSALSGVTVGVLGDTPAASETNRCLSPRLKAKQLVSKGSDEDLLGWLEAQKGEGDQRIAICDHVVARNLRSLLASSDRERYSSDLVFSFAQPVPVGLVYPREDREWRRVLSKAIAYSLLDLLKTDHWDTARGVVEGSIAGDFDAGGIAALSLDELRSSLLLDLTFDEAIRWNQEMTAAAAARGQRSLQPKRERSR